jgi:hypothetical protein
MSVNWRAGLAVLAWSTCCALAPRYGGPHDFDFEFGSWSAHLTRLTAPLRGSKTWVSYDGTSVVHLFAGRRQDVGGQLDRDLSSNTVNRRRRRRRQPEPRPHGRTLVALSPRRIPFLLPVLWPVLRF